MSKVLEQFIDEGVFVQVPMTSLKEIRNILKRGVQPEVIYQDDATNMAREAYSIRGSQIQSAISKLNFYINDIRDPE